MCQDHFVPPLSQRSSHCTVIASSLSLWPLVGVPVPVGHTPILAELNWKAYNYMQSSVVFSFNHFKISAKKIVTAKGPLEVQPLSLKSGNLQFRKTRMAPSLWKASVVPFHGAPWIQSHFLPLFPASLTLCATPASRGRRSSITVDSASLHATVTAPARRMRG